MKSETPNGASGRIAHRVAAADEEGERRGETKMKKIKGTKVATIAVTPDTTSKTLRHLLYDARAKSKTKIDQLDSILDSYRNQKDAVPEVLLSVHFLMDWYADGINEPLSGMVSGGLSRIIRRCAYETAARNGEHEELLEHSDLRRKIRDEAESETVS
jgi:hypothetical protein